MCPSFPSYLHQATPLIEEVPYKSQYLDVPAPPFSTHQVFAFDDSRTRERLPPPSATPTTTPQRSALAPAAPSTLSAPSPLTLDRVAALSPAALTASLVAYANHHNRHADPRLLDAVARRVSSHVEEYGGSELVAVLQAYSTAGQAGAYRDFHAICCAMLTCKVGRERGSDGSIPHQMWM